MAKQKLTQVTVQGLATNPNPNALPAGSCAVLNNAVMRRPGIIQPTPAWQQQNDEGLGGEAPRKLLYSDFSKQVIVVGEGSLGQWELPDTFEAPIDELPADAEGGVRSIEFLPGRTQTAFSHFRSFITEGAGIVTNLERWAGLSPPAAMYPFTQTNPNGFLLDTYGVAYRAHFSLESTDPLKPYVVDGPVSAIGAVINDTGSTKGVQILAYAPPLEPFFVPENCKLYINIYRSSSQIVDFVTELPDDFRRVTQVEITNFTPTFTPIFEDDVTNEARSNGLPLYTNGIGQEGGQGSSFAPPTANDVTVFKDTMFYANRSSVPSLAMTVPGAFGFLVSERDREFGIGQRQVFTAGLTLGSPDIVFSDPADIVGITPGQLLTMPGFADPAYVVSVNTGTNTVTMDNLAEVTDTDRTGNFFDMIRVTKNPDAITPTFGTPHRVIYFDFDAVAGGELPGFRMLHPAVDTERTVEGITLTLLYTWQAIGVLDQGFGVVLTNGQNYRPAYTGDYTTGTEPLRSLIDVRPNRVFYSKTGKPEEVPLGNFLDVGSGTILKMWANQSANFCFCTDGLWRITGDGSDFSVFQIDPTALLVHPDAVGSLNNQIYAWVTDGIATVTEDGATTISTDAIGPQIRQMHTDIVRRFAPYCWGVSLCGDSFRNEVWLIANSISIEASPFDYCVTYNDDTKNFSNQVDQQFVSAVYAPNVSRVAFLAGAQETEFNAFLPSDYSENFTQLYLPLTVWFNPLQTDDKGNLKQWMDLNYFSANYNASNAVDAAGDYLKALFDARGESTDATALILNANNMTFLRRDVHYWVPRRTALSDQQQIGFRALTYLAGEDEPSELFGFYIEIQGFTMRYRVASDTLKK